MYCTPGRAKKVTASMLLVSVAVAAVIHISRGTEVVASSSMFVVFFKIYLILFFVIVPVTVLVINAIVACEVRRASNNTPVSIGPAQHYQPASSNSAVPTVMLVATSLVYFLLGGTWSILFAIHYLLPSLAVPRLVVEVSMEVHDFVYSYNFYMYLITGKLFRYEVLRLFRCCRSAGAVDAAGTSQLRGRADTRA